MFFWVLLRNRLGRTFGVCDERVGCYDAKEWQAEEEWKVEVEKLKHAKKVAAA